MIDVTVICLNLALAGHKISLNSRSCLTKSSNKELNESVCFKDSLILARFYHF